MVVDHRGVSMALLPSGECKDFLDMASVTYS